MIDNYSLENFKCLYEANEPKHILLGNGFSLSLLKTLGLDKPAFSYKTIIDELVKKCDNSEYFNGDFENALKIADTYNLETIIEELSNLIKFSPLYGIDKNVVERDVKFLKEKLPQIIGELHPDNPSYFYGENVKDELYESCANFLRVFKKYAYEVFLQNASSKKKSSRGKKF